MGKGRTMVGNPAAGYAAQERRWSFRVVVARLTTPYRGRFLPAVRGDLLGFNSGGDLQSRLARITQSGKIIKRQVKGRGRQYS
jgi:hypothetical protein